MGLKVQLSLCQKYQHSKFGAHAEAGLVAEPEKRGLNAAVDAEAEVPIAKKTRTESVP